MKTPSPDGPSLSRLNTTRAKWLESHGVPGPFQVLGGGFRTDVLESRGGFVVRVGKHPADGNTFSTQTQVMDAVRSCVDIELPRPTLAEDGVPEFSHGVMVYPKLEGVPPTLPSRALARSAASVLRQLHALGAETVVPGQVVDGDGVAALVRSTRACFTAAQRHQAEQWQIDLCGFLAGNPRRCLIHGDFWHANWLATKDSRTITGLLDFEHCGIGLPHEDLAPLRYLGERFRTAALDVYCEETATDPASLLEEVRLFDVLRELRGLDWALRNPDAGEVDDSIEKVAEVLATYPRS